MKRTLLTVLVTALLTALFTAAVLGAGAAWYAGGFFVDFALRRGSEGDPTAPPSAFRIAIEGAGRAIRPAPRPKAEGEAWTLSSFDGHTLRATHFIPEEDSHRWVILLHGYGLTQAHVWNYASEYLARGFHALTPDQRASGKSGGVYVTMGALEARDVVDWTRRIVEHDPEARIVLHGVSMGAAAAMLAAGDDSLPGNVDVVVEDSGYSAARTLFAAELRKLLGLSVGSFLDLADLICQERTGVRLSAAAPVEAVRRARLPILFIHGSDDRLVPFAMMETLYAASASSAKERLVIPRIGHGALCQSNEYYPAVFAFVERWLGENR
ncbi:MAG: alpha/beta hydrolase [Oscillospiraceae bacterium]|nr:alpha/beta hydrolase [Oscillospiraceae bacterium]